MSDSHARPMWRAPNPDTRTRRPGVSGSPPQLDAAGVFGVVEASAPVEPACRTRLLGTDE
jgi:hypothetical protein